jgi:hypothetical protein
MATERSSVSDPFGVGAGDRFCPRPALGRWAGRRLLRTRFRASGERSRDCSLSSRAVASFRRVGRLQPRECERRGRAALAPPSWQSDRARAGPWPMKPSVSRLPLRTRRDSAVPVRETAGLPAKGQPIDVDARLPQLVRKSSDGQRRGDCCRRMRKRDRGSGLCRRRLLNGGSAQAPAGRRFGPTEGLLDVEVDAEEQERPQDDGQQH